ncbi:MAG: ComEA family DNA-binding protein [Planctomycetota bacterium]
MRGQSSRWFQLSGREIRVLLVAAGLTVTMLTFCEVRHQAAGRKGFRVDNAVETLERPTRVDINTAEGYELQLLPGIGPKTAKAVIRDRKEKGLYDHLGELERVNGIGAKTVERLRPHVMCRPPDDE